MSEQDLKSVRFHLILSSDDAALIDEWAAQRKIRSRGEAIRRLCQIGMAVDAIHDKLELDAAAADRMALRFARQVHGLQAQIDDEGDPSARTKLYRRAADVLATQALQSLELAADIATTALNAVRGTAGAITTEGAFSRFGAAVLAFSGRSDKHASDASEQEVRQRLQSMRALADRTQPEEDEG
jgi:hypothetical protein